jgi:hypothetical protein
MISDQRPKPLSCYFGIHEWIYNAVIFEDKVILQTRVCQWCGHKVGRVIDKNSITRWM